MILMRLQASPKRNARQVMSAIPVQQLVNITGKWSMKQLAQALPARRSSARK